MSTELKTVGEAEKMPGVGFTIVCFRADKVPIGSALVLRSEAEAEIARLRKVLEFVQRGMRSGHIKCAAYIDHDPNAESLEIKHPADLVAAALNPGEQDVR